MTVAVHRHDGGGLRRDGGFDLVGIEVERNRVDIHKYRLDTIPQQRVGGSHEGIRCSDDFARDAQGLQGGNKREGAIGEKRNVFDTQVVTKRLFKLLVKRAAIGQPLALPDLLQVGNEFFQWGQQWLRDLNWGFFVICVICLFPVSYWSHRAMTLQMIPLASPHTSVAT